LNAFLLVLVSFTLKGQETAKYRSLKLTLGGGYGHYFNTFTNVLDEDIQNNRPCFEAKLLWQPEYRLRLGLESGYYFIYSTTRIETTQGSEKLTTHLKIVPIFISISMKVVKNLELNFGTGWASMIYVVAINNSKSNRLTGHTYSMSNYTAGLSYFLPVGKRIELGTEFKYLYLGKTNDYHISGFLYMAYKFKKWDIK
jgi:hypothetical protein